MAHQKKYELKFRIWKRLDWHNKYPKEEQENGDRHGPKPHIGQLLNALFEDTYHCFDCGSTDCPTSRCKHALCALCGKLACGHDDIDSALPDTYPGEHWPHGVYSEAEEDLEYQIEECYRQHRPETDADHWRDREDEDDWYELERMMDEDDWRYDADRYSEYQLVCNFLDQRPFNGRTPLSFEDFLQNHFRYRDLIEALQTGELVA